MSKLDALVSDHKEQYEALVERLLEYEYPSEDIYAAADTIRDLIAEIDGAYESHGKIMADWNEAELSLRNKLKAEQQQRNILRDTLDEDRAEKYALELKLDEEQARRVEAERRLASAVELLWNGSCGNKDCVGREPLVASEFCCNWCLERIRLFGGPFPFCGHTPAEPTEEGTEQ